MTFQIVGEWQDEMCRAARQRRRVELVDGRVGTLVYWPGRHAEDRSRKKPLRHGDPRRAGVRFDDAVSGAVSSIDVRDVVGFEVVS